MRVESGETHDVGIGEKLDVGSTAIESVLKLDLVLDDESLAVVDEGRSEGDGDGVVSGFRLDDQTVVARDSGEHARRFHRPFSDVREDLGRSLSHAGAGKERGNGPRLESRPWSPCSRSSVRTSRA